VTRLAVWSGFVAALILVLGGCGGGGEGSDIAFVSTRDGDYATFAMDASGGGQHRLTKIDIDTSSLEALFFQVEPAWSPDGTQIAFSSRREGTFDIYVMKADGSDTRRLTSTKQHDSHPSFAPDGQQIVFGRDGDIFVMRADGSNQHRISDPLSEEVEPSWSPDGEWIAYVRRTPGTPVREIWLAHPNGSDRHKVTNFVTTIAGPAWSPDSKRIAFSGALEGTVYDIYSVGSGGKGLHRHTQSTEDAFEPAWSPDGSTIAFMRDGAIVTIDQTGNTEEITNRDNNDSSPAWNPEPAQDEQSSGS
jgi:Tol biopolymer transport system component